MTYELCLCCKAFLFAGSGSLLLFFWVSFLMCVTFWITLRSLLSPNLLGCLWTLFYVRWFFSSCFRSTDRVLSKVYFKLTEARKGLRFGSTDPAFTNVEIHRRFRGRSCTRAWFNKAAVLDTRIWPFRFTAASILFHLPSSISREKGGRFQLKLKAIFLLSQLKWYSFKVGTGRWLTTL